MSFSSRNSRLVLAGATSSHISRMCSEDSGTVASGNRCISPCSRIIGTRVEARCRSLAPISTSRRSSRSRGRSRLGVPAIRECDTAGPVTTGATAAGRNAGAAEVAFGFSTGGDDDAGPVTGASSRAACVTPPACLARRAMPHARHLDDRRDLLAELVRQPPFGWDRALQPRLEVAGDDDAAPGLETIGAADEDRRTPGDELEAVATLLASSVDEPIDQRA